MDLKYKIGLFLSNRKQLTHLFFAGLQPQYRQSKHDEDTFWKFVEKMKSNPKYEKLFDGDKREQLRKRYLEKYESIIAPKWRDDDELRRGKSKQRIDMRTSEVLEFRDILLVFIDFREQQNEKNREKLREFQRNLPIYEKKQDIFTVLEKHPVLLIVGDTGCGKSTQVPQYLLAGGYKNIACTQPRRLACISLRNRLAFETNNQFGTEIGYQIRFEKRKSQKTRILFLTEGLLLRQMIEDPLMKAYDVVILDEIHERHLSCDFLLGAIKCLLYRRQGELKVILMSATVNWKMFAEYFNCFVISVPGRLYPIETQYFPIEKLRSDTVRIDSEPFLKMLRYIDDKFPNQRGDVLIFLSGSMEIENVGEMLKTYAQDTKKWVVLFLHSQLPFEEQDKVFDIAPEGLRKCVLATNIAETSLTIDGIRFVIDSGKVKEMFYEVADRTQKLQEVWVSKASADQRKGRAGRTGPGHCFRLYSEKQFEEFDDYPTPEIRRTALEPLLLKMISMGVDDVRQFPFIEGPSLENVESTLRSLVDYETLEDDETITVLGKILSRLPVDISIGKMLVMAVCFDLIDFFLSACACLSVQSIFTSKSQNNLDISDQRKSFVTYDGDIFFHIRLYSEWLKMRQRNENTRKWCRQLGVEEQRFFEITKLRNQFCEILADTGLIDPKSLNKRAEESLSKQERLMKNNDKKMYGKLKRELEEAGGSFSRKVLKVNHGGEAEDEEDEQVDRYSSMKSVEFKLLFDARRLEEINAQHSLSSSQKRVAKLIAAASYSTQFAFPDLDSGSYRADADRTFVTRDRPSVVVHPSSVFYSEPEMLRALDTESSPFGVLSSDHQLIGYTSLIETSKNYICNCFPISSIHALLFAAKQIDVDTDFVRVVADKWIQFTFPDKQHCRAILLASCRLRRLFKHSLLRLFVNLKLDSDSVQNSENPPESRDDFKEFVYRLQDSAKEFFNLKPKYSMKTLTSYAVKKLYTGQPMDVKWFEETWMKLPLIEFLCKDSTPKFDSPKGGVQLDHLNFDCLNTEESLSLVRTSKWQFVCEHCGETLNLNAIDRARHEDACRAAQKQPERNNEQPTASSSRDDATNSKDYYCETCQRSFAFTSKIEILRHRQKHPDTKSEK